MKPPPSIWHGLRRLNGSLYADLPNVSPRTRAFGTKSRLLAPNRIYDPIRSPADFDTLTLLHASSRTALITFWTASWCPSCKAVGPLVRNLIEKERVGENKGGVGFAEVEFDSPTLGDITGHYMASTFFHLGGGSHSSAWQNQLDRVLIMRAQITSIPTLLAFSRGEPQQQTRLTNVAEMKEKDFLRLWVEDEAMRGESGGKGGTYGLGGLFGFGGR